MGGVLFALDLGGAERAVRADPLAHGGRRAFAAAPRRRNGPGGRDRRGSRAVSPGIGAVAPQHACWRRAVAMRLFGVTEWNQAPPMRWPSPPCDRSGERELGHRQGRLRRLFPIFWSAGEKFIADDGWAIASYIGADAADLAVPVPDLRRGAGRLLRLGGPCERGGAAGFRRMAGRRRPARSPRRCRTC